MNNPIQSIVVTTDFSDAASNAVRVAAGIAHRQGAVLRLLHVATAFDIAVPPLGHYSMVGRQLAEAQREESAGLAQLAAETSEKWRIACTADEVLGGVGEAVSAYAKDHGCDLIVIGSRSMSGLGKFFLGSNAIDVLKRAHCPVLAVPEGVSVEAFRNILFPVRAVPDATEKYDFLRPIIARNGATVHVAGVAELGNPDRFMYVNALTSALGEQMKRDGVSFTLEKHFCPDVADTILSVAQKRDVDLLVVTSTLEKDFWKLFSGPFSKQMLDRAEMAVLMVRPGIGGTEASDISSDAA